MGAGVTPKSWTEKDKQKVRKGSIFFINSWLALFDKIFIWEVFYGFCYFPFKVSLGQEI